MISAARAARTCEISVQEAQNEQTQTDRLERTHNFGPFKMGNIDHRIDSVQFD